MYVYASAITSWTLTATTSTAGGKDGSECCEMPGEEISDILRPAWNLHIFKKGEHSTTEKGKNIKEKNNCYFESVAEPTEVIAIKHFYF